MGEAHSKPLGCIKTQDLLKYSIGVVGALVGTALTIGLWVKNVESQAVYAEAKIVGLENRIDRLEDQYGLIADRLARIETKLDYILKVKR